jgi:predicted ribosome quality control (RQC) complex YloA/Tae2 family protein
MMAASKALSQRSAGMDVFYIEAVMAEMQPLIARASVKKVHQPDADTVILRLWNGRRELRLRICVAIGGTGIYLSERTWINPASPPRFCQLLRARLKSLRAIEQLPGERVVVLTFNGHDEASYRLVVELYGRRPNMVLCDGDDLIIDVLHRRQGDEKHQAYMKGAVWRAPEKLGKWSLKEVVEVPEWEGASDNPAGWLQRHVCPMTPWVARDLACLVADGRQPGEVLALFSRRREERDYLFQIAEWEGSPRLFAFRPYCLALQAVRTFPSASEAADRFYAECDSSGRNSERAGLKRIARRALARIEKRLERLRHDILSTGESERLQQLGQLLMANFHKVDKGMNEVEVENFFEPGTVVNIPLDPALSPSQNADRLFAKSKKIRRGYQHVRRRLAESTDEKAWLETLLMNLDEMETHEDLAAVEAEMRDYGLLPKNDRKSKRPASHGHPRLREDVSPGGYTLQWGTSNRANDYLVKRVCRSHDLWFHALDRPGCHLVLKISHQGEEVPEEDILYAASLAAGYSKASAEGLADVMVAEGSAVHKPKGALPGLVRVKNYRTVRVSPRRNT